MTKPDPDPELEALLTRMADAQAKSQRMHRRSVLMGGVGLAVLWLLNTLLALVAGEHPRLLSELVAFGGLSALGLCGWWIAYQSHRVLARGDADLLKEMRRSSELANELQTVTPLLRAINEAHGKGQPLMVMPPDDDGPAPDGAPPPTMLN